VICGLDDQEQKMNISGGGYKAGHWVNLNKSGTLDLSRLDSPSTKTSIGQITGTTAPTDWALATIKVVVTPTQIRIQQIDGTPSSITTVTDSTYASATSTFASSALPAR
jgi:hypothetical protein